MAIIKMVIIWKDYKTQHVSEESKFFEWIRQFFRTEGLKFPNEQTQHIEKDPYQ